MFLGGGLTKDGDGHLFDFDLTVSVCDRALIGAAVLRGGSWDTEDVNDPVGKSLFHLNGVYSL